MTQKTGTGASCLSMLRYQYPSSDLRTTTLRSEQRPIADLQDIVDPT